MYEEGSEHGDYLCQKPKRGSTGVVFASACWPVAFRARRQKANARDRVGLMTPFALSAKSGTFAGAPSFRVLCEGVGTMPPSANRSRRQPPPLPDDLRSLGRSTLIAGLPHPCRALCDRVGILTFGFESRVPHPFAPFAKGWARCCLRAAQTRTSPIGA